MRYKVTITDIASMDVFVEAGSVEEAENKVADMVSENRTALVDLNDLEHDRFEYKAEEADE